MIRVITKESYMGHAANAGGPVETKIKSFDLDTLTDIMELEKFLRMEDAKTKDYLVRELVGYELLES